MRVSVSVLRWLSAGICALVVLLLATVPAAADTGTYRITNYMVTLQPQSDGQVRITIVQDWRVLGGHIPWVTVGLPNKNFSVASFSSAASNVALAPLGANGSGQGHENRMPSLVLSYCIALQGIFPSRG